MEEKNKNQLSKAWFKVKTRIPVGLILIHWLLLELIHITGSKSLCNFFKNLLQYFLSNMNIFRFQHGFIALTDEGNSVSNCPQPCSLYESRRQRFGSRFDDFLLRHKVPEQESSISKNLNLNNPDVAENKVGNFRLSLHKKNGDFFFFNF